MVRLVRCQPDTVFGSHDTAGSVPRQRVEKR